MITPDIQIKIGQIKTKIEEYIEKGYLEEAKQLIDLLEENLKEDFRKDPDLVSMKAVILILEGAFTEAENVLLQGLEKDTFQFDLLFNMGYIREIRGEYQEAADFYLKACTVAFDENQRNSVNEAISRLTQIDPNLRIKDRPRIAFFIKDKMNNFFEDIMLALSDEYWVRKITVSNMAQVDEGMKWADVSWFEWCDELIIYASSTEIAKEKKIICRIHGYEVYTNNINKVNWSNVDKLIIVAPHIKRIFLENLKTEPDVDIELIFCGINVDRYPLIIKTKGFNLGYLGFINFKKNLPLTLDIFKKLHDMDERYCLHIAGQYQDPRTLQYIRYFLKEHGLEDSYYFYGWADESLKLRFFKIIDYMVISSIDEGLCFAAAEAMASGIKPVLHNCEGIKDHYDKKYIFSTIDEAVEMVMSDEYDSIEYRKFIEANYSLKREIAQVKKVIESLLEKV